MLLVSCAQQVTEYMFVMLLIVKNVTCCSFFSGDTLDSSVNFACCLMLFHSVLYRGCVSQPDLQIKAYLT